VAEAILKKELRIVEITNETKQILAEGIKL